MAVWSTDRRAPGVAPAPGPVASRRPGRSPGVALAGLAAVVVGAWGAVCGYVGPYFGFRPLAVRTWVGSLQEGLLHLAPGAVAVVAGAVLMALVRPRRAGGRGLVGLCALALAAAGAWFVIGPVAWPAIESGAAFLPAGPLRHLLDVAAASYAPGLVLAALAGMAAKAAMVGPGRNDWVDPMTPVEAGAGGPVVGRPAGASPVGASPVGASPAGASPAEGSGGPVAGGSGGPGPSSPESVRA
jgi:hypothetical protein